jgi:hypothetical protein
MENKNVGFSKEFLVHEYWRFVKMFNKHPNSSEFHQAKSLGYPSVSCYKRQWGNWRSFLLEIGVIDNIKDETWLSEDEEILRKYYEDSPKEDIITMFKGDKTWTQAVRKAKQLGLKRSHTMKYGKEKITKEFLIDEFWRYYKENNVYPMAKDMSNSEGYPHESSYLRTFGSWNNLLNEIGLLGKDGWYKCDEETLQNMYSTHTNEEINEKLMVKKSSSTIAQKANRMRLRKSHNFRYGTDELTDDELLNFLSDFYKENNRNPTVDEFNDSEIYPSYNIYRHRFGSWNEALSKAGLDPKFIKMDLSEKDLSEIKSQYLSGVSCDDIALKFGYKDGASVYYQLKKMNVQLKTNKWSTEQIKILREYYPFAEWEVLLDKLYPFRKEDIVTKAYKLKIKRECFGYSENELEILNSYYGKIPFKELKVLLPNKSDMSIMSKASRLGLKYRQWWTEQEIEELKELYPITDNRELARKYGRSITSIMSLANNLDIKKSANYYLMIKEENKPILVQKLIEFANELGRTPTSQDISQNHDMPGVVTYHRYFGSYSKACEEANLEVNSNIFGDRFHVYTSKNNDMCLSKAELTISDLLYDNNVSYEKEVLYRDIADDERFGLKRCDWLVDGNIIVEFFGMADNEIYKSKMEDKIQLCLENDLVLLSIFPKDLRNNCHGLVEKFREFEIEIAV